MNTSFAGVLGWIAVAALLPACSDVLGTSAFRECQGSECGAGGAGGGDAAASGASGTSSGSTSASGTTSSSGTGSATASTGSGPACYDVMVVTTGDLRVRVAGSDILYEEDEPGPFCLPAGPVILQAECHGEDQADVTSWGNAVCPEEGVTCSFDLQAPQSFSVTSTCRGD